MQAQPIQFVHVAPPRGLSKPRAQIVIGRTRLVVVFRLFQWPLRGGGLSTATAPIAKTLKIPRSMSDTSEIRLVSVWLSILVHNVHTRSKHGPPGTGNDFPQTKTQRRPRTNRISVFAYRGNKLGVIEIFKFEIRFVCGAVGLALPPNQQGP